MFQQQTTQTGCPRGPTAKENDRLDAGAFLNQCLEAIAENVAARTSQELERQTAPLRSRIEQVATAVEDIHGAQALMAEKLRALIAHSQLLEKASQEHARLSEEHYHRRIIEPMVRLLFPVVDVLDKAKGFKGSGQGLVHGAQWAVVEQIQIYLTQFFCAHDIRPIRNPPGSALDPKVMKPVRFVPCHDANLDGRLAGSLQAGFVRGTDQVLRCETVALYRYEEPTKSISDKEKESSHDTSD